MAGKKFQIGDAVLKIAPTLRGFKEELERDLKKVKAVHEVTIRPDMSSFMAELKAGLKAAPDDLRVKVRADVTDIVSDTEAAAKAASKTKVKVKADVDTAGAEARIRSLRAELEAIDADIEVGADTEQARFKVAVLEQEIAHIRSQLKVGADTVEARAKLALLQQHISRTKANIRVGANTKDAKNDLNDLEAQFRVVQGFTGTTIFNLSNIAMASTGIAGIVGLLGGVVAGATAAATALAAVGGAVAIGSSGVFSAFSELRAMSQPGATSSAQKAVDTLKEQREATQRVADAQQDMRNTTADLARDQQSLRDATKDATREIRDQRLELESAELSQESAAIAVARAKQRYEQVKRDYRRGRASGLDVQEANLGVRESQNRLQTAQNRVKDTREDADTTFANGVNKNPRVVDAKTSLQRTQQELARKTRELADARADAKAKADKAAGDSGAGVSRFDQAMAKLSPAAKKFVTDVRSLGSAWHDLKTATQDQLFAGLGSTLKVVAEKQMPELQRGMVQMAGVANGVLRKSLTTISDTFTEFTKNGTATKFWDSVESSMRNFAPTLDAVVRTLTTMTIEAGPAIGTFFGALGDFLVDGAQMWGEFGAKTMESLARMLPMVNRLFETLMPLFEATLPALEKVFSTLNQVLGNNQAQLAELMRDLGDAMSNFILAAGPLIPVVLEPLQLLLKTVAALNPGFLAFALGMTIATRSAAMLFIGMGNTVGRLAAAKLSLSNLGKGAKKFSRAFRGDLGAAAEGGSTLAAKMGRATKRALLGVQAMAVGMTSALKSGAQSAATGTAAAMSKFKTAVQGAAIAASTNLRAAWAWMTALPGRIMASTVATRAATAATVLWGRAQLLVNRIMAASPFGKILMAVGALVAVGTVLYNTFEPFKRLVDGVASSLSGLFGGSSEDAQQAAGGVALLSTAFLSAAVRARAASIATGLWAVAMRGLSAASAFVGALPARTLR